MTRDKTAQQLGIDLTDLEADPNSSTGMVLRPKGRQTIKDEVVLAEKVAQAEGRTIILTDHKRGAHTAR